MNNFNPLWAIFNEKTRTGYRVQVQQHIACVRLGLELKLQGRNEVDFATKARKSSTFDVNNRVFGPPRTTLRGKRAPAADMGQAWGFHQIHQLKLAQLSRSLRCSRRNIFVNKSDGEACDLHSTFFTIIVTPNVRGVASCASSERSYHEMGLCPHKLCKKKHFSDWRMAPRPQGWETGTCPSDWALQRRRSGWLPQRDWARRTSRCPLLCWLASTQRSSSSAPRRRRRFASQWSQCFAGAELIRR